MVYNPDQHHRRSIRLRGYDYRGAGAYFVTICAQDRECLFGEITDGEMRLNDAGRMVRAVWDELPDHYRGVDIDAFVVMPNHVHGIVWLVGAATDTNPGAIGAAPGRDPVGAGPRACPSPGQARGPAPTGMSLPDVVHRFKTLTTTRYTDGVKQHGWPPFPGRLWQRNYYEHIIRDDPSLNRIRQYVLDNPARWEFDQENPAASEAGVDAAWRG